MYPSNPKEIKNKIVQRLKAALPGKEIKKELSLEEWMTSNKLLAVTYDGSSASGNEAANSVFQDRTLRFSVHVRMRDILQNEDILDLIENIKKTLNGFKVCGDEYDNHRLVFESDEPDTNLLELGIWSHRISFHFEQEEHASPDLL